MPKWPVVHSFPLGTSEVSSHLQLAVKDAIKNHVLQPLLTQFTVRTCQKWFLVLSFLPMELMTYRKRVCFFQLPQKNKIFGCPGVATTFPYIWHRSMEVYRSNTVIDTCVFIPVKLFFSHFTVRGSMRGKARLPTIHQILMAYTRHVLIKSATTRTPVNTPAKPKTII